MVKIHWLLRPLLVHLPATNLPSNPVDVDRTGLVLWIMQSLYKSFYWSFYQWALSQQCRQWGHTTAEWVWGRMRTSGGLIPHQALCRGEGVSGCLCISLKRTLRLRIVLTRWHSSEVAESRFKPRAAQPEACAFNHCLSHAKYRV